MSMDFQINFVLSDTKTTCKDKKRKPTTELKALDHERKKDCESKLGTAKQSPIVNSQLPANFLQV